jgi:hypothetical protein
MISTQLTGFARFSRSAAHLPDQNNWDELLDQSLDDDAHAQPGELRVYNLAATSIASETNESTPAGHGVCGRCVHQRISKRAIFWPSKTNA